MSDTLLVLIGLERNSTIDQILNLQNGVEMQNKCFHSIFFSGKFPSGCLLVLKNYVIEQVSTMMY